MKVNKEKVVTDSIFLTVCNLIIKLKGIILIPIVIHYVGLANYGVFIALIVNKDMITPIACLALGQGFNRYTSKLESNKMDLISRDYWSVMFLTVLLAIVGVGIVYQLAPWISFYILEDKALETLKLSSWLVLTGCLWVQTGKFIASRKHLKLLSLFSICYSLIPYIAFVLGIAQTKMLHQGILYFIIAEGVIVLILIGWVIKKYGKFSISLRRVEKFAKYSWPLMFSEMTDGLLSKVDRYFIGFYLGASSIGIYNIVYSACTFLETFTQPFLKYFAIYLPKVWDSGDKTRVFDQLKEGVMYYLILSFAILASIIFLLRPVLSIILKSELSVIANVELLALIIGLGIIAFGSTKLFYQIINYQEKTLWQLVYQIFSLILNVVLNIILIPKYGILGAAIATLISYLMVAIFANNLLKINLGKTYGSKIIFIVLSAMSILSWFYICSKENIVYVLCNLFLGLVLYVLLIFGFRVLNFKDLKRRFT